ncbi:MAG: efflux RND transporter periplasmic adaptor subunit [Elusimicrobiota bacterium]|jgi:macrolide-specific efflux system membrane fusion protein
MSKKWWSLLAVILITGSAYFFWMRGRDKSKSTELTTQTVTATQGSIEDRVEATGTVQPLNRVEIKPPIAGRVEKLILGEGDRVKAGDILAWMSSSDRAAILDAARAQGLEEVKKWEDAYKPTPIVAPLSGVIILKNVVVGQTVDASTVLYAMSDKLIVVADVDEADIGRVRMDMPAVITLDSYPDAPIQGKVFQILYEGKNVSNVITYGVKIEPANIPPFFRSQMTANINLISNKKENVVLLPAAAIYPTTSGERQVYVPGPDGKRVPRTVQVGLENGDQAEITEGIAAGEQVLVTRKRYTPQQAASSSPLIMGGPKQSQQQSGQSTRRSSSGTH